MDSADGICLRNRVWRDISSTGGCCPLRTLIKPGAPSAGSDGDGSSCQGDCSLGQSIVEYEAEQLDDVLVSANNLKGIGQSLMVTIQHTG